MGTGDAMRRLLAAGAFATLVLAAPLPAIGAETPRVRRHLPQASVGGCGSSVPVAAWPKSGYYLEMTAVGQVFHVWVTSEAGIARVAAWLAGAPRTAPLGIPGAPIELDPAFNPGFSYRLKPGEVTFADAWIEVCDAAPCFVEKNAAAWVTTPGSWCPWAAKVRKVWDCSGADGTSCGTALFQAP